MRILLDECVPWPTQRILAEHECKTVQQCGWSGLKNGDLLSRAEEAFDLFLTADQNIRYQQNLANRKTAIIELSSNDIRRIRSAASLIREEVLNIKPGEFRRVAVP